MASIYNAYYKVVFLLDSDVILGKVSQKKSRKKCGVFTKKKLTHNFFLENEPLMRGTNFTLGPI